MVRALLKQDLPLPYTADSQLKCVYPSCTYLGYTSNTRHKQLQLLFQFTVWSAVPGEDVRVKNKHDQEVGVGGDQTKLTGKGV